MREKLFKLTRKQRSEMEREYKTNLDRRIADRIQAILLLDSGRNQNETAEILHINRKTVKRWIKIFVDYGLDDLCTLKYENSGVKVALDKEQQSKLEKYLDEYVRSTKEAMAWVEKELGVKYSESGMSKLIKRMGYSYKKPSIMPSKADPQKQSEWVDEYRAKKNI